MGKKRIPRRVYIVSLILSLILYAAGVLTGIFTERYITSKTWREIQELQESMEKIKYDIENLQLQDMLFLTLGRKESCKFLSSLMGEIESELSTFWSKLPPRLEEYEFFGEVPESYIKLKKDYTFVALRAWIISLNLKEQCDPNILPVLYFYSKNCKECLEQGYAMDRFRVLAKSIGKTPMVFTLDLEMDEPVLSIIKKIYNLTEAPSIILDSKVFRGFTNETVLFNSIKS